MVAVLLGSVQINSKTHAARVRTGRVHEITENFGVIRGRRASDPSNNRVPTAEHSRQHRQSAGDGASYSRASRPTVRHNIESCLPPKNCSSLPNACAAKLELDGKLRHVPSFSDAEDQCEDEYEELLQAIHEDELFAPVDIQRQEQLVEQIAAALPEGKRMLIVELADNHARHVWLQQEGAYHLGLAVGRRLRLRASRV